MLKTPSARLYKERLAEFGRKISGVTRLTPLLLFLAEEVRGMLRADRRTDFTQLRLFARHLVFDIIQ